MRAGTCGPLHASHESGRATGSRCLASQLLMLPLSCRWTSMYNYYLNAMDAIYKVRCVQSCSTTTLNTMLRLCRNASGQGWCADA